jgi:hypothetical protein
MTVSENDWLRRHLTVSKNEPLALRVSEIECLVKSFSRQMTVSENDQLRHHLSVSKNEPLAESLWKSLKNPREFSGEHWNAPEPYGNSTRIPVPCILVVSLGQPTAGRLRTTLGEATSLTP